MMLGVRVGMGFWVRVTWIRVFVQDYLVGAVGVPSLCTSKTEHEQDSFNQIKSYITSKELNTFVHVNLHAG